MEHHGFLLDIADLGTVEFQVDVPDIDAVHQDLAVVIVVITHQQVDQRGLTGAGGTNDTHNVTRLNGQAHIGQRLLCPVKGEVHIPELDMTVELGRMVTLTEIRLWLRVDDIQQTFGRVQSILDRVIEVSEEVHGLIEHGGVGNKGHQQTGRNELRLFDHQCAAHAPDQQRAAGHHKAHNMGEQSRDTGGLDRGLQPLIVVVDKGIGAALLVGKGLDDPDAGDIVRQNRGHSRPSAPHTAVEGSDLLAEDPGTQHHKRHRDQRQQGQFPVHTEHDNDDADHLEELHHHFLGHTDDKLLDGQRVAADTVDHGTGGSPVVEPHGHSLGFFVHIISHIRDELIAADTKHIGPDSANAVLDQISCQQQAHADDQHILLAVGQNIVHQGLGHVGGQQGHARSHDGQQDTHKQHPLIGHSILDQFLEDRTLGFAVDARRAGTDQVPSALGADRELLLEGAFDQFQFFFHALAGGNALDIAGRRVAEGCGLIRETEEIGPFLVQIYEFAVCIVLGEDQHGVAVVALDIGTLYIGKLIGLHSAGSGRIESIDPLVCHRKEGFGILAVNVQVTNDNE